MPVMEVLIMIILFFLSLSFVIFWMVVWWRIMRAHEDLADSIHRISVKKYWQEQQSISLQDD